MQQRLFEITFLLTEQGSLTAGQLAERFGVSRRTIYRDIDALSSAGIPVYAEKGRGGGIRILPDYVLEKTIFTKEEQDQLVTQFQSLAALETPGSEGISQKLAALFGRRDSWLEIDFAPWGGGEEARSLFALLRESILRHEQVFFTYTGTDGSTMQRTVEPVRILFRGQGWYLYAWCCERNDFRIFKLSRIHQAAATGKYFDKRDVPPLSPSSFPSAPSSRLVLLVAPSAAFRVWDEFDPRDITPLENGWFKVDTTVSRDDWLLGFLLSYAEDIEVLEPQKLRETVKKTLEKTLEKYK